MTTLKQHPPPRARLVVIEGKQVGAAFELDFEERWRVRVGTADDNDVVLDDPFISRHHTEISGNRQRHHIRDDNSTHGVILNGERLAVSGSAELAHGDLIRLGKTMLRFELLWAV